MTEVRKRYDVVIIGGGPGGMSAAVWCADLGLTTLLLERNEHLGGQMLWTHNPVTNYLGIPAPDGAELAARFEVHVRGSALEVLTAQEVSSVDLVALLVRTGAATFAAHAIIIATGVRRRSLDIPGEQEFRGRGILVSGARDRESVRGKTVVIVGGGDAALENALILSSHAERVLVVHRREEFTARREFVEAAGERANIELRTCAQVSAIEGSEIVERVVVRQGSQTYPLRCDAVLIRIGVLPNIELFAGQLEVDERDYVLIDDQCRTSEPGVLAVGDVTNPSALTIATAVGHGAAAARSIVAML